MFASLVINFSQRRQPYAFQLSHSASLPAVEAYLQLLSELGRVDSEHGPKLTEVCASPPCWLIGGGGWVGAARNGASMDGGDSVSPCDVWPVQALEVFYQENCVEEEPGKFRCPLSGKLFKDAVFVRKHIDNKHPDALLKAKAHPRLHASAGLPFLSSPRPSRSNPLCVAPYPHLYPTPHRSSPTPPRFSRPTQLPPPPTYPNPSPPFRHPTPSHFYLAPTLISIPYSPPLQQPCCHHYLTPIHILNGRCDPWKTSICNTSSPSASLPLRHCLRCRRHRLMFATA